MWKIDANGDASNELGEKIWLTNERGCLIIRRTTFVATKKWRGFTRGLVASFPKNQQGQAPLTGRIKITVKVFTKYEPESLKSDDWDKHGKAVSDALNGNTRQVNL